MEKFNVGDIAYIVESNNFVREVTIKRYSGGFYLVQFDNDGGIKVREKRLFHTKEDAIAFIKNMGRSPRGGMASEVVNEESPTESERTARAMSSAAIYGRYRDNRS